MSDTQPNQNAEFQLTITADGEVRDKDGNVVDRSTPENDTEENDQ